MRQQILDRLTSLLKEVEGFERVRPWDEVPATYAQNEIFLKDTREKYEKKNSRYQATLSIEIVAIVIETEATTASDLGNIAIARLIEAVLKLSVCGAIVNLSDCFKYIATKGKTACEVELNIDVKYQF